MGIVEIQFSEFFTLTDILLITIDSEIKSQIITSTNKQKSIL